MESKRMADEKAAREARLKAALRDNLRKRKAQARGRGGADDTDLPADSPGGSPDGDSRGAAPVG